LEQAGDARRVAFADEPQDAIRRRRAQHLANGIVIDRRRLHIILAANRIVLHYYRPTDLQISVESDPDLIPAKKFDIVVGKGCSVEERKSG
jgi:hypothetical protein